MIVSTKKPSTRFMSNQAHNSYGLQNYLLKKGWIVSKETKHKVDKDQYNALINVFVMQHPKWTSKEKRKFSSMEKFAGNHFADFARFCKNKFQTKNNNDK